MQVPSMFVLEGGTGVYLLYSPKADQKLTYIKLVIWAPGPANHCLPGPAYIGIQYRTEQGGLLDGWFFRLLHTTAVSVYMEMKS